MGHFNTKFKKCNFVWMEIGVIKRYGRFHCLLCHRSVVIKSSYSSLFAPKISYETSYKYFYFRFQWIIDRLSKRQDTRSTGDEPVWEYESQTHHHLSWQRWNKSETVENGLRRRKVRNCRLFSIYLLYLAFILIFYSSLLQQQKQRAEPEQFAYHHHGLWSYFGFVH